MLPQHQPFAQSAPSYIPPTSINNRTFPQSPALQRQNILSEASAARASFLDNPARASSSQLPQNDYLYQDAQYLENKKETANVNRLERWHLDYFLKETRQPLQARRRNVTEEGDPSHVGRRRGGDSPALTTLDSSFGEYTKAAKIEESLILPSQEAAQQPLSVQCGDIRTARASLRTLSHVVDTSTLLVRLPTLDVIHLRTVCFTLHSQRRLSSTNPMRFGIMRRSIANLNESW